ncbi:MAG: D-glycerate dehydrogenase [Deltaproteobacteria bacterium HGW-Deltaproteobacteria-14]|jgi:glyoxylate reductase|nr:MAG: D-glycerate dehydrogenase [Deltaproteobacteria bacterium HGW-Deltaproteobacteria-14]
MKRVFVTWPLPDATASRLASACELVMNEREELLSRAELLRGAAGAFGLLTTLRDRVDAAVLDATGVRVVANWAVGFDNIEIAAARARKVWVTNTPDVLTESTADLAFALLFAVSRRVVEGDRLVRRGEFRGWHPGLLLGHDLHGKTLGIVGLGRIGRAVARRALAFGMRVIYHGGRPDDVHCQPRSLGDLLAESDIVTLHVPLTQDTRALIGANELAQMKRGALLVNTARGDVVDEDALVAALARHHLGGAGLDVFSGTPERPDERLFALDNVVLTPHIGSATHETRLAMAERATDNLLAALAGKTPPDLVWR